MTTTAALLSAAVLIAGCSSDDGNGNPMTPNDLLLGTADVPGAEAQQAESLTPSLSCNLAAEDESTMQSQSDGSFAVTSLTISGTTVQSAVFELDQESQRTLVFDKGVVTDLPRCIANTTAAVSGPSGRTTIRNAELSGLPSGAVGYVGTLKGEDGSTQVEERAYAAVGNRIVVVSASRKDADPLGVSVSELLAKAVAKAEAAPVGEQQPA